MKNHFPQTWIKNFSSQYLQGLALILADISICGLTIGLAPMLVPFRSFHMALEFFAVSSAVLFFFDYILAGIGVSMTIYLIVNAIGIAGSVFLTVYHSLFMPYHSLMVILTGLAVILCEIHGAFTAYRLPASNTLLRYGDGLIVMITFYLYSAVSEDVSINGSLLGLSVLSMMLMFLIAGHLRSDGEDTSVIQGAGTGGKLIFAAILILAVVFAAVFTGTASGQIHSIVDLLLAVIRGVGHIVLSLIDILSSFLSAIVSFLISMLPSAPEAEQELALQTMETYTEAAGNESSLVIPPWLAAAVFLLFVVFTVSYLLVSVRKKKIKRQQRQPQKQTVIRKSHALSSLRDLILRIADRIAFEYLYLLHRKTPQGLYILAVRTGKKRKLPKKKQESPGAYIRRLSCHTSDGNNGELLELAAILDVTYYTDKTACTLSRRDCQNISRQIYSIKL